jgi:hypothetical protein
VRLDELAAAFRAFYIERQRDGRPVERNGLMAEPGTASLQQVAQLIVRFPLDRFVIQGLLEYDAQAGVVRFARPLWDELRVSDLREAQASAEEQLHVYVRRIAPV